MNDNYILDFLGGLQQRRSQKQVNADIKTLEKTINMLRLTATLAQGSSKKELNAYIKILSNQLSTIKLKAKIDSKNLKSEIDSALNKISFKDIDILNIDENKTKLKMQKVLSDTKSFVEKNPIVVGINISSKKSKLDNDLTTYLNRNTKINESSVLLKEANKVRDLIDAITDKRSLTEATDAFRLFKSEVSATGFASKSTADKVKSMLGHITKIGSVFGVASIAVNNFVKSIKTLQSNDTILTEISKTSEMTKSQLKELGDEAFKVASKFGQLSSNYLLAVQEMARSGYEETSKELGELSLLAQSAGDMTAENANNYLLATDAAYKYGGSVEKLNAALDGANYISNKNSATLTDISDAIRVSASFAANASVAIDELTAAEATMIATTKRSGSEIGRAFRSIVLNLQQVSGEFDGEVIDEKQLKKVEERCHSLGVELEYMKDGIATLRNPIEVLKDLAEVYNSLPDNSAEKQGLISDLGGKYHANALSALLSRWDLYEKMLGEFSQGAGSALEEAEKTADSWEGRLNSLQNSWDSFVNTLTNKEAIMGGVSLFDKLIQGAESFIDTFGEIPVLLTTINTSMTAMKKDFGITQIINPETKKLDLEGNLGIIDFSAIKKQKTHFEEANKAISGWNSKLLQGQTDIEKFEESVVQNNASLKSYLQTTSKDAPASLAGYKASLNAAGVSTDALRIKTILLNSAISMGIGVAIQIAMNGVSLLVNKVDELAHSAEHCKERVDEVMTSYQSTTSTLRDNAKEISSLSGRYDQLSKGVGNLGNNISLTEDEFEEYHNITSKIAETYPDLVDGWDAQGNAIVNLTDSVKELNSEYEKSLHNANLTLMESKDDIFKNYENTVNDITKQIEYAEKAMDIVQSKGSFYDVIYDAEGHKTSYYKAFENLGLSVDDMINGNFSTLERQLILKIQSLKDEMDKAAQDVTPLLNAYLSEDVDYQNISDEKLKTALSTFISSLPESLVTEITENGASAGSNFVEGLVDVVKDDDSVQNALIQLLSLDTENLPYEEAKEIIDNYISIIVNALNSIGYNIDPIELQVELGLDIKNVKEDLRNRLSNGTQDLVIDDWVDSLSEDEAKLANSTAFDEALERQKKGLNGAALSAENYSAALDEVKASQDGIGKSDNSQTSISQTIDQLNTRLKPAFDSLNSAWNEIFTDDDFKLNSIDILSTCDAIKSKLDEMSDPEGLNLDVDYSAYENFVRVLSDTESTADDVEKAFDYLANSITQAALTGEEDLQTMNAALEDLGISFVANDELVAFKELIDNTTALEEKISSAGLTMDDFVVHTEDGSIAATDAARAFIEEMVGAENCQQALALLQLQQMLCNENSLNTTDDINACLTLAKAAGVAVESLSWLANVSAQYDAAVAAGDTVAQKNLAATMESIKARINAELANFEPHSVDFSGIGKGASKAGKKAGDAYVDAFEKELKKLQTLRDQGKITEKQYLDYLRKLYQRFFRDKKKYAEQYAKYEHEYLQGMKSLYESALSGITSMLDKQISAYGDSRDAAVESLEAQRDAAIEAKEAEKERYEQEIELIDKQIAAKQKAIQKVQDEIDAMRSANAEKKQAINLQQDEYNLQRMLNQRSKQVYKDGQIVFETDTSGVREAKQKVEDDKLEIEISKKEKEIKLIEKEIDLLNEKKDGVNENIDLLDKQIDQIDEYYSKLIADTEKYWNNIISGMQDYKSRWEELGEIEGSAKVIETLQALGIEVDDVLGMSEEAFSKFKDDYVGILADIYSGNDSMLSALSDTTGRSVDQMGSYLDATQGYIDSLGGIGDSLNPLAESIGNVEESMGTLSSAASEANDNLSNAAGSVDNVNSSLSETALTTSTVATNVGTVVDGLNQMPESGKVSGLAGEFETLATKIREVAKALGIGEGEAVSTLFQAMSELNTVTLGGETEGIIGQFTLLKQAILDVIETIGSSEAQTIGSLMSAVTQLNSITLDESIIKQFTNLKTTIDSVTAAISGGGGESSEGEGSGGGSASKGGKAGGKGSEGESGGGNSLTGAIKEIGETAKKVIGEPDAEGDGTVIGEFGSMETAVNDVASAIGTGDSEGGDSPGKDAEGDGDGTLIGSIEDLGKKTAEEMGESGGNGIIGRFEEFRDVIGEADGHVKSISDGLDNIDGKTVECTIKINVETSGGSIPSAIGVGMNLGSAQYDAKYLGNAHVEGTALASGDWAVQSNEDNALVGEVGYEIIVRDGKFFTVGDNGPEMFPIRKGDIVFNHEQSVELLKNGHTSGRGKAYADGTVGGGKTLINGQICTPVSMAEYIQMLREKSGNNSKLTKNNQVNSNSKGQEKLEKTADDIEHTLKDMLTPTHIIAQNMERFAGMDKIGGNTSNISNIVNNNKNVQPVVHQQFNITMPNVTDSTTATSLMNDLQSLATKKFQMDW